MNERLHSLILFHGRIGGILTVVSCLSVKVFSQIVILFDFSIILINFQARSVCKSLKVHGVHTVSIHPGASLDHQIQGYVNNIVGKLSEFKTSLQAIFFWIIFEMCILQLIV